MYIHKMRLKHVDEVHQLGKSEGAFIIHQGHPFWTIDQLSYWIRGDQDVLLVAIDNEKVIGFALSQLHRPTGKATIENVCAREDCRGQQIGERLILEVVLRIRDRGATYACLCVNANNKRGISYFERFGFERASDFAWLGKFL